MEKQSEYCANMVDKNVFKIYDFIYNRNLLEQNLLTLIYLVQNLSSLLRPYYTHCFFQYNVSVAHT